jgi:hypothetical protein
MSEIVVTPFTMKDVTFTVEADDYKQHVSRLRCEPTTPQVKWKGLAPAASFTDTGNAEWTLNTAIAQDWDNPDSLCNSFWDNQGETKTATIEPKAGGQAFTITFIVAPPAIGGDIDNVATAEITHGLVGAPVKVAP